MSMDCTTHTLGHVMEYGTGSMVGLAFESLIVLKWSPLCTDIVFQGEKQKRTWTGKRKPKVSSSISIVKQ